MRNTPAESPWDRVVARWALSSQAEHGPAGALTYDSLDGRRTFWLRATSAGSGDDTAAAWVPFRHRGIYPPGAPPTPDAPFLLVVRAVAQHADDRDDFRRWLSEEHGPRQTTLPGVRWLHTYEQVGEAHSFLNLWGIDDPAVVDGEAWVQVRRSPWWDRVAHVAATADRGVYRRSGATEPD